MKASVFRRFSASVLPVDWCTLNPVHNLFPKQEYPHLPERGIHIFSCLLAALAASDVVLDAIFGFSFQPPVRAPFDAALPLIARAGRPIVSVDVPSGWNVDEGKADARALDPDVLVSLTAPKEGVRAFKGRHFLGGRFVPKYVCCRIVCVHAAHWSSRTMEEKLQLNLPEYPGFSQIVELPPANDAQKL